MPAEIYWRRRLLVLAAVIALVWAGFRFAGGGEDPEPKSAPAATPAPSATPTVAAQVDGLVSVSLVSARRTCDPEKIRMTPTVKPDQLTRGPVRIGLVVSSTEKTACTLTPAAADLVAVISANTTAIWDSTVCKDSLLPDAVSISPQWATLVTATWSGRGSGGGCSAAEGYATPGTYKLQVGTLGGEPGKATFTLDPRPKPTKTKPTKTAPTKSTPTPKPPKGTTKPND